MHVRTSILCQRRLAAALTTLLLVTAWSGHADDKPPPGGFFGTFEGHYLDNIGEKTRWGMTQPFSTANFNVLPKWGGGGRVGLGYRSASGWDVVALGDADWLYSGQQQVFVSGPSQFFVNTLAPPGPFPRFLGIPLADVLGPPAQVSSDAQLAYSYVDLEGGYNLKLGTIFEARLFGGARYANFDQEIDTTGVGTLSGFPLQIDNRNEVTYWGVGPRVGANTRLRIFESPFYLVTAVSGSALFGDMRVRERESHSSGLMLNFSNRENTMYTARTAYNGEGEMGILYDVSPILQGLDVTIGYRLAGWFGVNDTRTTVGPPNGESHANVVTQGTFLRINVRY
jgi:hypothetical protein